MNRKTTSVNSMSMVALNKTSEHTNDDVLFKATKYVLDADNKTDINSVGKKK